MTDSRLAAAVAQLAEHGVGKTLAAFTVYGFNSLKTVAPAPEDVVGSVLSSAEAAGDTTLRLVAGAFEILIDLQRVGALRIGREARAWTSGQPSMPTVQFVFDDGTVAHLSEPGKTKRVTVRIAPLG